MDIRKLQRQAASCVDELLSVSGDMDVYVIAAYDKVPWEVVAMQCRILLERLKRLGKKLAKIQEALACVTDPENSLAESGSKQPEGGEAGKLPGTCTAVQIGQMEIPGMPDSAEGLSGEQRRSIAVTQQIIAQNLLLIARKEELLNGFLAHADMIGIQEKRAKELQDTAEIIRLKQALLHNSQSGQVKTTL